MTPGRDYRAFRPPCSGEEDGRCSEGRRLFSTPWRKRSGPVAVMMPGLSQGSLGRRARRCCRNHLAAIFRAGALCSRACSRAATPSARRAGARVGPARPPRQTWDGSSRGAAGRHGARGPLALRPAGPPHHVGVRVQKWVRVWVRSVVLARLLVLAPMLVLVPVLPTLLPAAQWLRWECNLIDDCACTDGTTAVVVLASS